MYSFKTNLTRSLSIFAAIASVMVTTSLPTRAQTSPSPSPSPASGTTENQRLTPLLQQAANSGFSTLARLVAAAGVGNALQSQGGEYTILAPTDAAFAQLPTGTVDRLLRPENRDLLRRVLAYHVIPQAVTSDQLKTGGVSTLGGGVAVRVTPERIIINNGSVVQPDIQAQNGVVHAISQVLVPTTLRQQLLSLQ
ncbi:MAG: fasciclin domain-containing protein [Leptolyngbya sp. Prado105]|nr:fasciclin domain-containing protein [Leptolyngbya sp. Prado105]